MRNVIVSVIAILAVVVLVLQIIGLTRSEDDATIERDFFVDERDLTFVRRVTADIPPLPADDGVAAIVIARCFQGDDGIVIGWLERYTAEAKADLEALRREGRLDPNALIGASMRREVRRPTGDGRWVPIMGPEAAAIRVPPRRADGTTALPAQPSR